VAAEKINPENYTPHPYINKDKFTLLYSGNIGEKQNWLFCEQLCEFIQEKDCIEIVIVGDGAYNYVLKSRLAKFDFVKFFPPVPYNELSNLLCSAEVHFLFQKQDVVDTIMPSKILGMMASAIPSIVTGHEESEVKHNFEISNGGFYYYSDDKLNQIITKINHLIESPQESKEIGKNARKFIIEKFSMEKILSDFETTVKK